MTARIPLPTRLQLQTLAGLQTAIVGGANTQSNAVISTATALSFINAFEDDFLAPLRLIWMRWTDDNIVLDQYGTFDLRTLSYPVLEVVSLYAKSALTTAQNAFWQFDQTFDRKDLTTFRRLQGVVNNNPIYTIDGPTVRVWPRQNWYGPVSISYYADWPRLGDLSTNSVLQQQLITLGGVAATSGTIVLTTSGNAATATVIPVVIGDTAATLTQKIANANIIFSIDAGNNPYYWNAVVNAPGMVLLTAPQYVATQTFTAVLTGGTGITVATSTQRNANLAYVQNNWFLDNYPYIYYFGALKHVFLYLNDLERAKWATDQVTKLTVEMQAISDRADASDTSDNFNMNREVNW